MRWNLRNLRKHTTMIDMFLLLLQLFTLFYAVSSFKLGSSLSSKQQRIYEIHQPQGLQLHRNGNALLLAGKSTVHDDNSQKTADTPTLRYLLQQPSELSTRNDIIIIAGFEAFNIQLYKEAAAKIT